MNGYKKRGSMRDCVVGLHLIIFVSVLLSSVPVYAQNQDTYAITRYSFLQPGVSERQRNLLDQIVRYTFRNDVTTVGQAIETVLFESGYRLASRQASDPKTQVLYFSPLPRAHRQLGPASTRDVLGVLAGPAWVLVTDHVNRLVTFDLAPVYETCEADRHENALCR